MKQITQLVSSSVLLVLGFVVAALSLRGMHADSAFAASPGLQPSVHQSGLDISALTDGQMPGSVPYIAQRGWERAETLWLTDDEKVEEFVTRLLSRRVSAERAWESGKFDLATTTYLKAYGYVHEIVHMCFAQNPQVLCEGEFRKAIVQNVIDLENSLQVRLEESTNDALRAKIDGLLSRIQVLREQFHLEEFVVL